MADTIVNNHSGISIVSQNVNSLNLSSRSQINPKLDRTRIKLLSIFALKADIILLQDVRLCDKTSYFVNFALRNSMKSYHVYHNSSKDSRGVCILICAKADYVIHNRYSDLDENILLLKSTG